ncbi:MAG: hypothetical protein ABIP53_00145 [Candidatus Limnocylindrales bacterium]
MTDKLLEQRLRAWYRASDRSSSVPINLRTTVLSIADDRRQLLRQLTGGRNFALLAAAALLAMALVGVAVVGAGIVRLTGIVQASPTLPTLPSLPAVAVSAAPTVAPDATSAAPTATAASGTKEPTPVAGDPTTTPVQTTATPGFPADASRLIAVYHGIGEAAQILLLDPVTGEQAPIGTVDVNSLQLRSGVYGVIEWSSDRATVTISRVTDGAQVQSQIDVATRTLRQASFPGESYVSPSGDRLAGFAGDPNAIEVTDLAGTLLQRIVVPNLGAFGTRVVWAPDESAVAVWGYEPTPEPTPTVPGVGGAGAMIEGPSWIYVVPLDGSPVRQYGGSFDFGFVLEEFSQDGATLLAVKSCTATCTAGIVAIDLASGEIAQLTTSGEWRPAWSPDQTRIAFERPNGSGRGLWLMNADGSGLIRLTAPPKPDRDYSVAWSPDGASILFSRGNSTKTGLGDLYVVSTSGGEPQLLLTDAVADW